MKGAAHRAIDRALRVLTPSDGATPFRPAPTTCEPEEFFADPGLPRELRLERVRRRTAGGVHLIRKRFAFDSPVRSGVRPNDTVRGYWLSPVEREVRASVVILHKWKAPAVRSLGAMASAAVKAGAEVLLPAQPFHAWRRPRMTFSGMPLLSPDLALSLRGMRQAVLDVRRLLSWLQQRKQGPVLLVGVDLGGVVAALASTVHEGLDGLVVVAAHDRIDELLWQGRVDRGRFRGALERAGVDRCTLESAWAVLDAGWRPPLLPTNKVLLVGGRYDDVVSPEGIERLAGRWGEVRVSWHEFAHGSYALASKAIMKESLALVGLRD